MPRLTPQQLAELVSMLLFGLVVASSLFVVVVVDVVDVVDVVAVVVVIVVLLWLLWLLRFMKQFNSTVSFLLRCCSYCTQHHECSLVWHRMRAGWFGHKKLQGFDNDQLYHRNNRSSKLAVFIAFYCRICIPTTALRSA